MRTHRGRSLHTAPPHNRRSRLGWRLTATDPDRGSVRAGCGSRSRGGGHRVPILRRGWTRTSLGGGCARLCGAHAGHLSSSCRLAAGDGLMARQARTGSPRGEAALDRAPGVVPGGPGCSVDPWRGAPQLAGHRLGCSGVTLLFVLAAQVLAGVQFLRPSGPPGTLPAHIRRLKVRSRYRNE